ncbi:hypothetical protein THASP1DRAFT_6655, partial [Thamnocephalis sphaerospora]
RHRITSVQRVRLLDTYRRTRFPSRRLQTALAEELGLPLRSVQIWFQNQRQLNKTAATTTTSDIANENEVQ